MGTPRGGRIAVLSLLLLAAPALGVEPIDSVPSAGTARWEGLELGFTTFAETLQGALPGDASRMPGWGDILVGQLGSAHFDPHTLQSALNGSARSGGRMDRGAASKLAARAFARLSREERARRLRAAREALGKALNRVEPLSMAQESAIDKIFQQAHEVIAQAAETEGDGIAAALLGRATPPETSRDAAPPPSPVINLLDLKPAAAKRKPSARADVERNMPPRSARATLADRTAALNELLDKLIAQAAEYFALSNVTHYEFLRQYAPSSALERFHRHGDFLDYDDAGLKQALEGTLLSLQEELTQARPLLREEQGRALGPDRSREDAISKLKRTVQAAEIAADGVGKRLDEPRPQERNVPLERVSLEELGRDSLAQDELLALGAAYARAGRARAGAADDAEGFLAHSRGQNALQRAVIEEQLILARGFEDPLLSVALLKALPKLVSADLAAAALRAIASEILNPGLLWQIKAAIVARYAELIESPTPDVEAYTPRHRADRRYVHALLRAYDAVAIKSASPRETEEARRTLEGVAHKLPGAFQGHVAAIDQRLAERAQARAPEAPAAADTPGPRSRSPRWLTAASAVVGGAAAALILTLFSPTPRSAPVMPHPSAIASAAPTAAAPAPSADASPKPLRRSPRPRVRTPGPRVTYSPAPMRAPPARAQATNPPSPLPYYIDPAHTEPRRNL